MTTPAIPTTIRQAQEHEQPNDASPSVPSPAAASLDNTINARPSRSSNRRNGHAYSSSPPPRRRHDNGDRDGHSRRHHRRHQGTSHRSGRPKSKKRSRKKSTTKHGKRNRLPTAMALPVSSVRSEGNHHNIGNDDGVMIYTMSGREYTLRGITPLPFPISVATLPLSYNQTPEASIRPTSVIPIMDTAQTSPEQPSHNNNTDNHTTWHNCCRSKRHKVIAIVGSIALITLVLVLAVMPTDNSNDQDDGDPYGCDDGNQFECNGDPYYGVTLWPVASPPTRHPVLQPTVYSDDVRVTIPPTCTLQDLAGIPLNFVHASGCHQILLGLDGTYRFDENCSRFVFHGIFYYAVENAMWYSSSRSSQPPLTYDVHTECESFYARISLQTERTIVEDSDTRVTVDVDQSTKCVMKTTILTPSCSSLLEYFKIDPYSVQTFQKR